MNRDIRNQTVALITGGGLAYGTPEKRNSKDKATNLLFFGDML